MEATIEGLGGYNNVANMRQHGLAIRPAEC